MSVQDGGAAETQALAPDAAWQCVSRAANRCQGRRALDVSPYSRASELWLLFRRLAACLLQYVKRTTLWHAMPVLACAPGRTGVHAGDGADLPNRTSEALALLTPLLAGDLLSSSSRPIARTLINVHD